MRQRKVIQLLYVLSALLLLSVCSAEAADSLGGSDAYRYMQRHLVKRESGKRVKVMQRYFCAKNPKLSSHNALRYAALTERLGRHYRVDPFLVAAIIVKESTVRRTAKSYCSYGLMQINWDANKSWIRKKFKKVKSPKSLLHSGNNIRVGTYMVRSALDRTKGNVDRALNIYRGKSDPGYRAKVTHYYREMVDLFREFDR